MANAALLKANMPVRMFLTGYPGSGKTGSLVPLLEAGFEVRMLDFDANPEPIIHNASPEALKNLDIMQLQERMKMGSTFMEPLNLPETFAKAMGHLKSWKGTDTEGNAVDLGASKDWGPDTILVVDSLSTFSEVAMDQAMSKANVTPMNRLARAYKFAQLNVGRAISQMAHPDTRYHLIIMCHPRLIGPYLPDDDPKSTMPDEVRQTMLEQAALTPSRLYPETPGRALATRMPGKLPIVILAKTMMYKGKERRMFTADPAEEIDLKFPGKLSWPLPAEEAMIPIFTALGAYPLKGESK